jgi:hypothetical protein
MKRKGDNTLSPAQEFLQQKSTSAIRPKDTASLVEPKRLRDLGRDYTRYPSNVSSVSSRSNSTLPGARPSLIATRTPLLRTTTGNPFGDSQVDLEKWGYPDDSISALHPYLVGEKGFILYADELEADDKYHMPADDDEITYKPRLGEYFDQRSIVSAIGGIFLILGLLCVFIVLPILIFAKHLFIPRATSSNYREINYGPAWSHVNNNTYALLKNVRTGLIDPDTPPSAMTRQSTFDGSSLELVFSDEFQQPNRTFYPGDDPFWTATNIWYRATQDLEWYDPDAVTTYGGTLQLRMDAFPNHNLRTYNIDYDFQPHRRAELLKHTLRANCSSALKAPLGF